MKIRLGYVAIPLTLKDTYYFKTLTYTRYEKIGENNGNNILDNIILENLNSFKQILKYNYQNDIYFYRFSHNIIPLSTHNNVKYEFVEKFKEDWIQIGNLINNYKMRVDTHPDQFCVLNSIYPNVVKSSIEILNYNYEINKAMNIDSLMILHIGSSTNGKSEGIKRFKENFLNLNENIKKLIILENDDKIYNIKDVLNICEELNIPMVLDYLHYLCNNENEKLEDYLPRIINTWKNSNYNPKMHFSSSKNSKEKRSHSEYIDYNSFINFLNILKPLNTDIDIMLECKAKDEALFRLVRQLKFKTKLKFINNTTFVI